MQTPWALSITMVEHDASLYTSWWDGGSSARCSYCASTSASRQIFYREQNEEHFPIFTRTNPSSHSCYKGSIHSCSSQQPWVSFNCLFPTTSEQHRHPHPALPPNDIYHCLQMPPNAEKFLEKNRYSQESEAVGDYWDLKRPHWACGYDIRPLKLMAGTLIARVLCFLMDLWIPQYALSVNS